MVKSQPADHSTKGTEFAVLTTDHVCIVSSDQFKNSSFIALSPLSVVVAISPISALAYTSDRDKIFSTLCHQIAKNWCSSRVQSIFHLRCMPQLFTLFFLFLLSVAPFAMTAVEKSEQDERKYDARVLLNGMSVLLISDPTTDKASAAMDVKVGHLSDPEEVPGLAHFLEHMLFLGTEKYPDENEYNSYLNKNGGSSNAYTDTESTNYYFDITADEISGALDRFSQFFIAPLFTPSATDRELNAVDSEHNKNLQSKFNY